MPEPVPTVAPHVLKLDLDHGVQLETLLLSVMLVLPLTLPAILPTATF